MQEFHMDDSNHNPASGSGIAVGSAPGAGSVSGPGPAEGARCCAGCHKAITERFLLRALDIYWHEDCLKCSCCDCRLGEVGSTLYTRANLLLCRRDYLRSVSLYAICCSI